MSYCIVTEWEDGTVAVTQIEGVNDAGEDLAAGGEPSPEQLDRACWLVASTVESPEGSPDKSRIHALGDSANAGLPCYRVADDPEDEQEADVYVVQMGTIKLTSKEA
jgi:hypothetical protein